MMDDKRRSIDPSTGHGVSNRLPGHRESGRVQYVSGEPGSIDRGAAQGARTMTSTRIGIHLAGAFLATTFLATTSRAEAPPRIRPNPTGHLPGRPKQATVAAACERFAVLRVRDDSKALEGQVTGPIENRDTGEQLYLADFSALDEPGDYRLDIPGVGRSAPFRVGA